ncbi:MAG TPA: LysE family translocator [Devosia sp.]|nr:LysE family translocator [Devosia sp.]
MTAPMPSFVPPLATILAFALASLVLIVTPGPDMALQLSRSINYGRPHGMMTLLGTLLGLLVHSALVALGISILIVAAPPLFLALRIAGALYLIWLAWQAVRRGGGFRLAAAARQPPSLGQSFLAGVMIDLLNPKVVLFFVTFLPQFVHAGDPGAPGQLLFLGLEYVALSLPAGLALVWFADWIARALTRSRLVERLLNWGFAGVFAGFAALILSAQARHA